MLLIKEDPLTNKTMHQILALLKNQLFIQKAHPLEKIGNKVYQLIRV